MVINQQSLTALFVGYSAAFNKAYDETPVNHDRTIRDERNNICMDGSDSEYEGMDWLEGNSKSDCTRLCN